MKKYIIGRLDESDIAINNPTVSRTHAVLILYPDSTFEIQDQNSTNGVMINGKKIGSSKVNFADEIKLGSHKVDLNQLLQLCNKKEAERAERLRQAELQVEAKKNQDLEAELKQRAEEAAAAEKKKIEIDERIKAIAQKLHDGESLTVLADAQFYSSYKKEVDAYVNILYTQAQKAAAILHQQQQEEQAKQFEIEKRKREEDELLLFLKKQKQQHEVDLYSAHLDNVLGAEPSSAVSDEFDLYNTKRTLPAYLKVGDYKLHDSVFPFCIQFNDTKRGITLSADGSKSNDLLENIIFRLIASNTPKKTLVKIVDTEKKGLAFSNLVALSPKVIGNDVLDTTQEIDQFFDESIKKSGELVLSILKNQYTNIATFNKENPDMALPVTLLAISNFPSGFDRERTKKLLELLKIGNRVGLYAFISINKPALEDWKTKHQDLQPLVDELFQNFLTIEQNTVSEYSTDLYPSANYTVSYNTLPQIQHLINNINEEVNKVVTLKVDLNKRLGDYWQEDSSYGVKIPVGQTGMNVQHFELGGESNVHHALIGGATGFGKSVLLHNIIVNGAHLYSPDNLQFILLDYKEGTEFKLYLDLPHAKILSIGSEREYGLSVFEYLVEEIKNRGEKFREAGVANIGDYRKATGESMPRFLVVIDEFQVLLSGKDNVSNQSSSLLEDLSKRGRSFGINLLLSSQTLADVEVSTSTKSNIGLRIALKLNESDCDRILHYENTLPSTFSRAGQAVYNDRNGLKVGNTEFQVAYLSNDELKEKVTRIADEYAKVGSSAVEKFVYDGTINATVNDNLALSEAIGNDAFVPNDVISDIYIGEPSYLSKQSVKVRIKREPQSNVLVLGQDSASVVSIFYNSFYQLIKQSSPESEFYLFDLFNIDSGFKGQLDGLKDLGDVKLFSRSRNIEEVVERVYEELQKRISDDDEGSKRICIGITNAQSARELRKADWDVPQVTQQLIKLMKDGPDFGIHIFMHYYSYASFREIFDTNVINEFENIIALKGDDSTEVFDFSAKPVTQERIGQIKYPHGKYKIEGFRIYNKI
ncbi:FtsK/SpoIIIE domain-containing protein [uncultured Pontibacter sp.]|uniref:FtsK/SpoIIIE domain-containing protein n=1 Tax=uncultured Pontibacter sp. TaxID=453356 RepID=UPI0026180962|nr:FtsK/SpoIIIE domain-containing protein [uncultured Pontibacter sp.]